MQQVLPYSQIGLVGRWFFQNRSLTPLLTVCLLVVLPAEWSWQPEYVVVWLGVIALSEALRIWAVGYAGSATRTRGDVVPDLVVAGPYRWVRNPLYIANIAMYTAMGLVFGFVWLTLFIFIFSVVQYVLIVAYEEQTLRSTFGPAYEAFTATVPRWLPKLGSPAPGTAHRFNLFKALRSERSTLIAIAVMLTIWRVKLVLVSHLS
jgi:protein-S-isoprenylcysteine O-methyltransferase Ste14